MFAMLKAVMFLVIAGIILMALAIKAEAQPPTYLPWQSGVSYMVTQGNGGSYSHQSWKPYTRYGWDLGLPAGTKVLASAPGTVAFAGWDATGWGNTVTVRHSDGTYSRYGHLSSVSVRGGQMVGQAQLVGYSGNTGNSKGAHLHYQRENSQGYSLASSFMEAGVPAAGTRVTSRNTAGSSRPVYEDFRVYGSNPLVVGAGDAVRMTVTARFVGPQAIPCGLANFGKVDDRAVRFADTSAGWWPASPWRSPARVAAVGCSGELRPGSHARWDLTFRIPQSTAGGTYPLGTFSPVWEGRAWSEAKIDLALKVNAAYRAAHVGQSVTPLVAPGGTGQLGVTIKNTGTTTWQRSQVFLGTKRDQAFPYADASWRNPTRIAMQEATVAPGQVAHFRATMTVPSSARSARFQQQFALVLEGSYWFGEDIGIFLPIYVGNQDNLPYVPADYQATYVRQTNPVGSVSRGGTARVSVTYRNTGQAVLFRDGRHPVRLRGIRPADRASGFIDTSDALSAGSQGVRLPLERVNPGAEFTFTLPVKVSQSVANGTYQEYFRPVAEGTTWFGPTDVWWPFTVR